MATHRPPNPVVHRKPQIGRVLVAVSLAIWSIGISLPDVALPWHPTDSFGFSIDADGVVNEVAPNSPAVAGASVIRVKLD